MTTPSNSSMTPISPGRWRAPSGQTYMQATNPAGLGATDPTTGEPILILEPTSQPPHVPMNYGPPQPQVVYMQGPGGSVSKTKKDTSHTFHLIMSVITLGTWAVFVWIPITIWHKVGPKKKTVTRLS